MGSHLKSCIKGCSFCNRPKLLIQAVCSEPSLLCLPQSLHTALPQGLQVKRSGVTQPSPFLSGQVPVLRLFFSSSFSLLFNLVVKCKNLTVLSWTLHSLNLFTNELFSTSLTYCCFILTIPRKFPIVPLSKIYGFSLIKMS